MKFLKEKPFYLNDKEIEWVKQTYDEMSVDERIEHLFCPLLFSNDPGYLTMMATKYNFGGVMFRPGVSKEIKNAIDVLNKVSKIPLLISANLEDGGNGIAYEGTYIGRQMLIGATDDEESAYRLGKVCGKEGASLGLNWTFSPVVDIDLNFQNPITNVRTFGNNAELVSKMSRAYVKGLKEEGVIPSIKHFPGDGVDGRDQHLVTTVNTLTIDAWEDSFGKVYRSLIEDGAETVMVGHIAMPAMEEAITKQSCKQVIPATVSKAIVSGYLREVLGFNGVVTTDASPMVGMMSVTKRSEAVPMAIENGCDLFLFNKDLDEDIAYMKEGYAKGLLSEKRLEEAVTRVLALKATNIFNGNKEGKAEELRYEEHITWAKEIADKGITLVKDTQGLLPIVPEKHKKVLLQILGDFDSNDRVYAFVSNKLTEEGFEITKYVPESMENIFTNNSVEKMKKLYDLVIYVANIENASNKTVARLHWHTLFGAGNNLPWFAQEIPTLFISVGNPYHLYDVPMVKTFINGYCHSPYVLEAVIEKVLGRSAFKGKNPIDPFCGQWDTQF